MIRRPGAKEVYESAAVHANQSLEQQWINDEKIITRQGGP